MDFHSLCSPVHTNFLEAWICCALVLSNLTHSMNFYLEAITSMLSHWFWDQVITDWSILIHLWLPDLLHLLSCPIHSQSFCTHSWAALLSVLPCRTGSAPASSSRCQLKSTLLPQWGNSWEFFWMHHSEFPSHTWNYRGYQGVNLNPEGNKPWFLSCVPWLQIHLYFTFLQV